MTKIETDRFIQIIFILIIIVHSQHEHEHLPTDEYTTTSRHSYVCNVDCGMKQMLSRLPYNIRECEKGILFVEISILLLLFRAVVSIEW